MKGYSPNETTSRMAEIKITGNVIPINWYAHIVKEIKPRKNAQPSKKNKPSTKPYSIAIELLADIVYWYRPIEIRDETTGAFQGYRKKFKADKLQRAYSAFADLYGYTKLQVAAALNFLQDEIKVIDLEFRHFNTPNAYMSNVLFIGLNVDRLKEITFTHVNIKADMVSTKKGAPANIKAGTYTETTTESLIINLNGTSDRPETEQEPPEAPEPVEAYKHSSQPLHLPDNPLQAAQHLDLAPLVQLCGDLFIGRPDYEPAITAVRWIRDRQLPETHSNDDLINYLRPFWLDWCAGVRVSDGQPYAKNNIAWLRDHARINQRLAKPAAKGAGKKPGKRAGKTTTFDRNMQAAASRLEKMQLEETENQNHANQ